MVQNGFDLEAPSPLTAASLGKVLLHIGTMLLQAGAGSKRIVMNLSRIARAYGFIAYVAVGTRAISLTLQSRSGREDSFTGTRSLPSLPGVNFETITAISRLSWAVSEAPLTLAELNGECKKIYGIPHYSRSRILPVVGLAGLAFCYNFGGGWHEMLVAFVATAAGLALKQLMIRKQFNAYIVTFCAAFLAALVVALAAVVLPSYSFEHAFATCALFLIPGVPMIISFLDLLNGYILNGLDRGVNASIHAFAIAAGLATVIYLFGLA